MDRLCTPARITFQPNSVSHVLIAQDNAAFIKTKINNSGVLCLGYTQALRPGVKAAFGLALDT